jgi:hypothetical protein
MEASGKLQRKGKKSDGEGCAEKRKELQAGRGNVQNTNEQYHAQSLISLSGVVEFLSFFDDPVPLFSFLKPNQFPFNFIFN